VCRYKGAVTNSKIIHSLQKIEVNIISDSYWSKLTVITTQTVTKLPTANQIKAKHMRTGIHKNCHLVQGLWLN
jgi:hypothetical protein